MPLYSSQYLRNFSGRVNEFAARSYVNESLKLTHFDIFLSHSYLDYHEVRGLYLELSRLGYKVYVDWIVDSYLDRNNVTKETAELIRNRLKCSSSLLVAISENASVSKWIPWELGYMDSHTSKCAILPISEKVSPSTSFYGLEFFSLYPYIKIAPNKLNEEKLWIVENARKYVVFDDWFAKDINPFERDINITSL